MSRVLLILAVVLLGGCSILPDAIKVPEGTELVSYSRAVTGGESVKGKTARWGGVIAGVENKPNQTFVEIVQFPLNHYGRPNTNGETMGRFKVVLEGFVEPIIFESGRAVTFTGQVATPVAGMVDEQPYMYPAIDGSDYHLWRKQVDYRVQPMFVDPWMGWYSPFYYSNFYHPFWFNRPFYRPFPNRIRYVETYSPPTSNPVIIRSRSSSGASRATTPNRASNRTPARNVNSVNRGRIKSEMR